MLIPIKQEVWVHHTCINSTEAIECAPKNCRVASSIDCSYSKVSAFGFSDSRHLLATSFTKADLSCCSVKQTVSLHILKKPPFSFSINETRHSSRLMRRAKNSKLAPCCHNSVTKSPLASLHPSKNNAAIIHRGFDPCDKAVPENPRGFNRLRKRTDFKYVHRCVIRSVSLIKKE
jgi:hypothetical protein